MSSSDVVTRSGSLSSGESLRQAVTVVIKLLDLSLNAKNNITRCIREKSAEEETEEATVFVSVYDYLHHPTWAVSLPDEMHDDEIKICEGIRGNPALLSQVLEQCQGSIFKEFDAVHGLNCELFFARVDKAKLSRSPSYFYFSKADDFQRAIANGDLTMAKDVPEILDSEMKKHQTVRMLWAKRRNPKAKCTVLAVLHLDAMPKEIITFHSRAE
jgi:hypothetical protein